ncbi:hypothetical protein BGZ72_000513 [Mortierella alpina]|nr:hypothetical protein BGZ72_000513 [Mortierella alpina]
MICYKDTQCVPQTYFCDTISNPCTDPDGEPDSDDPILCNQDQLCVPKNYLPFPSPGSGKVRQTDNCLAGSYYSLYGSTKKYTKSCIEPYVDRPTNCEPWEYAAQSSCYLSTCRDPDLNCEPPFVCKKAHPTDSYGLCSNPNDPFDNPGGAAGANDGGSNTDRYSSKDYLIQGRAPGASTTGLGGSSTSSKHTSWLSTFLFCGRNRTRQRSAAFSLDTQTNNVTSSGPHRDSLVDNESLEGSLFGDHRRNERSNNNMLFSGRWRWGARNTGAPHHALSRTMMMMSMAPPLDPEMDPPPLYHIGPKLPAYTDRTEDMALTSVHATTGAQTPDPPESTRPSSHASSTHLAYYNHSAASQTDLSRVELQQQQQEGHPREINVARPLRHRTNTEPDTEPDAADRNIMVTDADSDMGTSSSFDALRHPSNTQESDIPRPEYAHLRKHD